MRILLGGIERHDAEVMTALPAGAAIFHAATAVEIVESVYDCSPDVLLAERELSGLGPALQQINAVLPVPVVLLARSEMTETELAAASPDIFGLLIRPVTTATLHQTLLVACRQFLRLQHVCGEVTQLRDAFAARKVIERAKGMVMQRRHLSESEAYSFLRDESRRQRIPIAELATALLGEDDRSPGIRKIHAPLPGAAHRQTVQETR